MSKNKKERKYKTEVLTANYDLKQKDFFWGIKYMKLGNSLGKRDYQLISVKPTSP
jgi:hypothetical protein